MSNDFDYMDNYNKQDTTNPLYHSDNNKKARKKSPFAKFLSLILAAVLFGAVSGAVFQGYQFIVTRAWEERAEVKENEALDNSFVADLNYEEEEIDESLIPVGNTTGTIVTDVSDVVDKVMPSIVAINSTATVTRSDFFGRRFNEPVRGSGSGIIIGQNSTDILIVTNNHVVDGAEKVEIVFADDSKATATIKGADSRSDIAVLSVSLKNLSKETITAIKVAVLGDSNQIKAGELAIAIGNALGYGQSVTVGYISALNREVTVDQVKLTLLQTDAAINPGNSGGALLNAHGEVIGINSLKYASAQVEGMGYAIPISDAIPLINDLMSREEVNESERGFLGIDITTAQNVTRMFSEQFNMPVGVYVNNVVANSPAEKAGLKQGHIIVGINGRSVETLDDLIEILTYTRAGQEITLEINVIENGKYVDKNLYITLGERPKR